MNDRKSTLIENLTQVIKSIELSEAYIAKEIRQRASALFEKLRTNTDKFRRAKETKEVKQLSQAKIDKLCLLTYEKHKNDRRFLVERSAKFEKSTRLFTEREQTISLHMIAMKKRQRTKEHQLQLIQLKLALQAKNMKLKKVKKNVIIRERKLMKKVD